MRTKLFVATLALVAAFGAVPAEAQANDAVANAQRFFSGKRFLVSHRDGGPVYGTYFFHDVHFGASGNFVSFSQSRKGNLIAKGETVNNWQDRGRWSVTFAQGQVVLVMQSVSGRVNYFPLQVSPRGVSVGDGVSIVGRGAAQIR